MKKTLLFILISVFSIMLTGCNKQSYLDNALAVIYQDGTPYLINQKRETYSLAKYDHINHEFGEYLVVSNGTGENRKYGFIKNNGEEIIKPKYLSATMFSENKAIVSTKNDLLIINPDNEVLYTFPKDMHSSKLYQEGNLVVERNGKFSYLNENFKESNVSFDYASSFVNGYAVVGNIIDGKLLYGLIDANYQTIIPLEHDFLDNYSDGFVRVGQIIDASKNEYRYRFMRLDGTYLQNKEGIIESDYALNFSSGVALIARYKTEVDFGTYKSYEYIDTNGEVPFKFSNNRGGEGLYYYDSLIDSGDTNTLVGRYRMRVSGAGSWYVLELFDGYLEEIPFTIPEEFSEYKNVLFYKTPYEMTNFKYSAAYGESSPLARVRIYSGEYGLVDATGTYILPAAYEFLFY